MRALAFVFLSILLFGCSRERSYGVADPISVQGSTIEVQPGSKFIKQLEVVPLTAAPGGERILRAVGQMIALANRAGALAGEKVSWATLDPAYVRHLGIHLSQDVPPGFAYGVTTINASYKDQVHTGERVDIFRYGMRQDGTMAAVVAVHQPENSDAGELTVIFAIRRGQDWYPGTNCQVEFPLIRRAAVALSPLSMLHEGIHDYVLKEVGAGQFTPVRITVLNETLDRVYALGPLSAGDRIVERGAILLKPIVHQIEVSHAR